MRALQRLQEAAEETLKNVCDRQETFEDFLPVAQISETRLSFLCLLVNRNVRHE